MPSGKVEMGEGYVKITYPLYPVHVQINNPKRPETKKKFKKVSGQNIYSQGSPFMRKVIVQKMHEFLSDIEPFEIESYPIEIEMEWHMVPNFQSVRMIGDKLSVGSTKDRYKPTFDCINQWLWVKTFEDVLVKDLNIIQDDNVSFINSSGKITYHPVETFEDRKLVFIIKESDLKIREKWLNLFNYEYD